MGATQLLEVSTPEFKAYSQQIINNTQALATVLMSKGYKLATDGTDNHLLLWDLRPKGLTGSKLEKNMRCSVYHAQQECSSRRCFSSVAWRRSCGYASHDDARVQGRR